MVKTNANLKYKDRNPEDTINLIKEFFNKNGYEIKIEDDRQSEAGTWFCHVLLLKNSYLILAANGKGINELYSQASGLSELYERFCNKISYIQNYYANQKRRDLISERGYFFDIDEKVLESYDELYPIDALKQYVKTITTNNEVLRINWEKLITNNCPIGLPYKNFTNESDIIYLEPRILMAANGSMGMAAGNSIEEALNQGISELYEKYYGDQFFLFPNKQYYCLNLNNIKNENIQKIIDSIKKQGYNVYVIDLSYTFGAPVLASIVLDPITKNIQVNFGAFPVFDIALERIFTELYQGIESFRNIYNGNLQYPWKEREKYVFLNENGNTLARIGSFPEEILLNLKEKNNFNTEIFLESNAYTNKEINEYFVTLNKKQGLEFYYRDKSLCEELKAIQIVCNKFDFGNNHFKFLNHCSPILLDQWLQTTKKIQNLANSIINNSVDETLQIKFDLLNYIDTIFNGNYNEFINNVITFCGGGIFDLFPFQITFIEEPLLNLRNLEYFNQNIFMNFKSKIYLPYLKKYFFLIQYIKNSKLSKLEIKNYGKLFNIDFTEEDFNNYNNEDYLFTKIVIEPIKNLYHSQEYEDCISLLL